MTTFLILILIQLLEYSYPQHYSPFRCDLSRVMRKQTFCICENKDADQLRGNREADQRLCFRYIDSAIPLLPKSEISSLLTACVVVQPGLCLTRSETRTLVFSRSGSFVLLFALMTVSVLSTLCLCGLFW